MVRRAPPWPNGVPATKLAALNGGLTVRCAPQALNRWGHEELNLTVRPLMDTLSGRLFAEPRSHRRPFPKRSSTPYDRWRNSGGKRGSTQIMGESLVMLRRYGNVVRHEAPEPVKYTEYTVQSTEKLCAHCLDRLGQPHSPMTPRDSSRRVVAAAASQLPQTLGMQPQQPPQRPPEQPEERAEQPPQQPPVQPVLPRAAGGRATKGVKRSSDGHFCFGEPDPTFRCVRPGPFHTEC